MGRAVVLSHRAIAHELGAVGDWLTSSGFSVDHVFREDEPTLPDDADLLVVLGSPNSVAEGRCLPAGDREVAQVREWLDSDRPYLGICFGAQVLALATGGRVRRLDETVRGWLPVDVTDTEVPGLSGPWLVWHEDGITAPEAARVLARTDAADEVFTIGRAWGIQFHPELQSDSLERMAVAIGADEPSYRSLVDAMAADESGHRARALALLDAFWADVSEPTAR